MLKKFLKILYHKLLMLMPKPLAHKVLYYKCSRKKLNLKNPKDLNEKLQYLMVYKYREKYGKLTDKYLVRDYIKEKGYSDILPKIYKIYSNINEINFDELPQKFVLKTNHGSGEVFICIDKKNFDLKKCIKLLNKSLKKNYAVENLEYHYSYINPKIICEEYLNDNEHLMPLDYKFYCFNGNVECILLCSERDKNLRLDYYDKDWNYLNYAKKEYRSNKVHEKPKELKKMLDIASNLSKGFEFVRVDLYNINEKVYFSELTFTPAAGIMYYHTQEALDYLGSLLDINKVKKE